MDCQENGPGRGSGRGTGAVLALVLVGRRRDRDAGSVARSALGSFKLTIRFTSEEFETGQKMNAIHGDFAEAIECLALIMLLDIRVEKNQKR